MPRRARSARAAAAAVGVLLAVAGCAAATPPGPTSPGSSPNGPGGSAALSGSPAPGGPAPGSATGGPAPGGPPVETTAARRPLVVLDPGHNGGNATHLAQVTRLVDAGGGRRKPCNEVGAATDAGYPEHAFAWDVAVRTRAVLAARGVDVRLTRPDDRGVGPCVDVRGRYGTGVRADAVVSVHADGADPGGSGFHVVEAARSPTTPANHRLALAVRDSLRAGSGLRYADYVAGGDGLDVRDDLAGLTLATRPSVLAELGNMHNPADAARLTSPAGRQRIAAALAAGILAYLAR